MHIPQDYTLDEVENARLEAYLQQRFQGNFSMAGIRFWPEMRGLDQAFIEKLSHFKQFVPVFTNVIFDTSQVHANSIFPDMFAWLNLVLELIRGHPDTLFVVRAHPDETRPYKESRETVQAWAEQHGLSKLPNAIFVPPEEPISSYELIQHARFVMVYNSSIGLEASLLGAPVLCAGKSRYTPFNTVFTPPTAEAFRQQAELFLSAEKIDIPAEFIQNARSVLYYQLFRTSLPFDDYLDAQKLPGFVVLKPGLGWNQLLPENSPALRTILDGLLGEQSDTKGHHASQFILQEHDEIPRHG
jgi:capsule polysaccharide modification protein KpsS